jgi:alkanesulfonate monooxygenase SsuD/methylene tetrahydromethanopterin reductase-like flavin-dependent oxidoreductase (luciferase family)
MALKLTMFNRQRKLDFKQIIERVKIADEAGIDSMWVDEAWGRDAFTLLTLLAEHTKRLSSAPRSRSTSERSTSSPAVG